MTQSRLTELVVSLPVLADDVTEVAVLADGRYTAMLRVNTGDPLLFVFDVEGEAPRITSLFVMPESPQTPTVTETADVEASGEPNDGEVIDDDDNGFDEFEDDGAWDVDDDDLSDFDD